jgi:hypothetical protein
MKLSNDQIDAVKNTINENGIVNELLRDDVLDHLCCVIEIKIERGVKFELALQEALYELAPHGLNEIQRETTFLLNPNKIILMKRFMYFIGLVSAMAFVLGWTFGMMHWPGATELSIVGFLGFVFIFIPLNTIDYFKTKIRSVLSEKLRLVIGIASAVSVASAIVFKLLHLPGADVLLLSGAFLFTFGFLPFLFFNMYKKSVS